MLHIIHQRLWNFDDSHSGRALREAGQPFRSFSAYTNLRYRTTAELLVRIYPRLVWNTLRLGVRSLLGARPAPNAVLVSTEIEALLMGVMRMLFRRRALIVLQTLIITPRQSPLLQRLHGIYWWCILRVIDLGICHATAEVELYRRRYPRFAEKFVFIPFGLSVDYRGVPAVPGNAEMPVLVTAGRSGRDYQTLVRAIEGLACRLIIICDKNDVIAGLPKSTQVTVLSQCFDDDYLQTLASASFVVVPLSVTEISAGQMVYLQAAALGRAVVMTGTATTVEYATDGTDAILVPKGDVAAMRGAIAGLLADPLLVARLGSSARARFQALYSTEAYTRQLIAAIAARRVR